MIGALYGRFGLLKRKFALMDYRGHQIAAIKGSLLHRYTFTVEDSQGAELGRITKEWSGFIQESMSDADTFRISYSKREQSNEFRLLMLASAFTIDLDFFESKGRAGIN